MTHERGNRMQKKRIVFGILLVAVAASILALTFQDPDGSMNLSEAFRHLIERIGIITDSRGVRSNIHLPVYFVLGIAISLFGRASGWKWWLILLIGGMFGFIDEGIKNWLPARESDLIDLTKDWIGIVIAAGLVALIEHRRKTARSETKTAKYKG